MFFPFGEQTLQMLAIPPLVFLYTFDFAKYSFTIPVLTR